jgi:hypothetical protein
MNEPLTDKEFEELKVRAVDDEVLWSIEMDRDSLIATVESLKLDVTRYEDWMKHYKKENTKLKEEVESLKKTKVSCYLALERAEDENDKLTGVIGKPFTNMDRQ